MINVEISKSGNDNTMQVIRKFSRRVQSSGLIPFVRKHRYWTRSASDAKKKNSALYRINKEAERIQLIKDGKISETPERRGRPHRAPLNYGTPSASAAASAPQGDSTAPASETSTK